MRCFIRKTAKGQSGQSFVEFAIVLPVFILMLFAIIEFGRLWQTVNVITSAAREGVRVAAVTAPDAAQVQTAAQNILTANNIANATITVAGPNAAREVTVTVQSTYNPVLGAFFPFVVNLPLTRSSVMRWEG